ncbi:hypothetical protein OF385_08415 [Glutamicibacter sp. JL.03c]|uniref:hypothetical protein n=1 Tax=Glutamicibacter sp. JL.03c TaxID=2984842 RepID=UPI0021F78298|nr:hypothetical protein [Glutamicibacter sp. JL.03c]UYQ76092.1 hypothetical protein OF385_08415 [Glutamicibacter sp. JL.03c]
MISDPTAPGESRLKRSALKRMFSSEKRYRHASALERQNSEAAARMRHQALRNEQWIYL